MNIYVLIGVSVVFLVGVLLACTLRLKRRLVCPATGTVEEVGVVHRFAQEDRPARVTSCSRFPDQKAVDCEQDCIKEEFLQDGSEQDGERSVAAPQRPRAP